MKNQRVQEYLQATEIDCDMASKEGYAFLTTSYDSKQAINMAEDDARKRAVIAHSAFCKFRIGDAKCRLTDYHTPCNEISDCRIKTEFVTAYDNQ